MRLKGAIFSTIMLTLVFCSGCFSPKGDFNVELTLEFSVKSLVRELSGYTLNPTFLAAFDMATVKEKENNQDFLSRFGASIKEINPDFNLASIFLYELRNKGITASSTNEQVLEIIRIEVDLAINRSFEIINNRIDRYGIPKNRTDVKIIDNTLQVALSGISDPDRIKWLFKTGGRLEFWETYNFSEVFQHFADANTHLAKLYGNLDEKIENKEIDDQTSPEAVDSTSTSLLDQLEQDTTVLDLDDQSFEEYSHTNPLYAVLNPAYEQRQGQYFPGQSAIMGYADIKDTATVNKYLLETKDIYPGDLKLAWGKKSVNETNYLELFGLKVSDPRTNKPALGGEVITEARQDYDQNGRIEISMSMNTEGAKIWKRLTHDNVGRQIAIVLDGVVYSCPMVNMQIPTGQSSISGNFTVEQAQDLANILKAGRFPLDVKIIDEKITRRE